VSIPILRESQCSLPGQFGPIFLLCLPNALGCRVNALSFGDRIAQFAAISPNGMPNPYELRFAPQCRIHDETASCFLLAADFAVQTNLRSRSSNSSCTDCTANSRRPSAVDRETRLLQPLYPERKSQEVRRHKVLGRAAMRLRGLGFLPAVFIASARRE